MKPEGSSRRRALPALARNLQKILSCFEFSSIMKTRPVLTITQMRVLAFFNDRDVIHISDISRRLDMSIQSVNNIISRLESTGYVQRSANLQDRRLTDIRLTDTGRASIESFQRFHVKHLQALLHGLSEQDRRQLTRSLDEAARILAKAEYSMRKSAATAADACPDKLIPMHREVPEIQRSAEQQ